MATSRTVFARQENEYATKDEALKNATPGDRITRREQSRKGREWVTTDEIVECTVSLRDLGPYLSPEEAAVIRAIRQFPRGHAGRTQEVMRFCADPAALKDVTESSPESIIVEAVRKAVRG